MVPQQSPYHGGMYPAGADPYFHSQEAAQQHYMAAAASQQAAHAQALYNYHAHHHSGHGQYAPGQPINPHYINAMKGIPTYYANPSPHDLNYAGKGKQNMVNGVPPGGKGGNKQNLPCPEDGWQYVDPKGNVQGPFNLDEMTQWNTLGYFKPHLKMRWHEGMQFVRFELLFPAPMVPFSCYPAIAGDR